MNQNPQLDATKVPSVIDIAWSAGIYEGEGTCRNCGNTKRGIAVQVVQKDPEILYRLRDWFGGSVGYAHSRTRKMDDQIHVWSACGDRARIFLALTYGFLSARRKHQVDAIRAFEYFGGNPPAVNSVSEVKDVLLRYYEQHSEEVYQRKIAANRERYLRRKANKLAGGKVIEIA